MVFHAVASPTASARISTARTCWKPVIRSRMRRRQVAQPRAGRDPGRSPTEKERGISIAPDGATGDARTRGRDVLVAFDLAPLDDDTLQRIADLYSRDPVLGQKLAEALAAEAIADEQPALANTMWREAAPAATRW